LGQRGGIVHVGGLVGYGAVEVVEHVHETANDPAGGVLLQRIVADLVCGIHG